MEDEEALLVCSGAMVVIAYILQKKKRRRRLWCRELYKKRSGSELSRDLKFQGISGQCESFHRMSSACFEDLLRKIGPIIEKKPTNMREPISVQDRLTVTLRFLTTGDLYSNLEKVFRISKQAIGKIIPEVCAAIVNVLKENLKIPSNPSDWMKICKVFEDVWNLPHCVGAIDGKQVVLQSPLYSSSHETPFSIVLFALVDGNYNFMYADIRCQGRIPDSGVFNSSTLYKMVEDNKLGLPAPTEIPGRCMKVPYFISADSAFVLRENIMKPYPGDHIKGSKESIFNYRLSRARRVVDNTFGVICSVFRVLRKPMRLEPQKVQLIVTAIVHLHNYLRRYSSNLYMSQESLDYEEDGVLTEGSWRNDEIMSSMIPLRNIPRRSSALTQKIRDEIADYCVKEGAVSWQNRCA